MIPDRDTLRNAALTHGSIRAAAKALGIPRIAYYRAFNADPTLRAECESVIRPSSTRPGVSTIRAYVAEHPDATPVEVIAALGLPRSTVYRVMRGAT